jgi:ribbon-helix-helix CopG family protein
MPIEMSHRLQITLTDEQYRRLQEESARTGVSLAELVRQALDNPRVAVVPPVASVEQRRKWADEAAGAWADRDDDSDPYEEWRRLRPPLGPPPE